METPTEDIVFTSFHLTNLIYKLISITIDKNCISYTKSQSPFLHFYRSGLSVISLVFSLEVVNDVKRADISLLMNSTDWVNCFRSVTTCFCVFDVGTRTCSCGQVIAGVSKQWPTKVFVTWSCSRQNGESNDSPGCTYLELPEFPCKEFKACRLA